MKLTKYNNYKNTNIHWLGDIPQHWEVKRIKDISELRNVKAKNEYLKVGLENIQGFTGKFISTETEFEGEGILFKIGDILFGKLRPYLAKVYLSEFEGSAVGDFFVIKLNHSILNGRFMNFLFLNQSFLELINSSTFGAKMPRVNWDFFSNIISILPPLSEQTAIANYLDQKTAQIDKKVELLTQKIEKYKELKKSLINQTVCRGLDKSVKLKPSGIDWIGDIPEHWEVKRGKEIFYEKSIKGYENEPLLAASQKYGVVLKTMLDQKSMEALKDFQSFKFVKKGDFVISLRSFEGGIEIAHFQGIISPAYSVFKGKIKIENSFYKFLFKSSGFIKYLGRMITGIRDGQTIRYDEIKKTLFILPPLKEQTAIAQYLDEKTNKIDQITANLSQQIEALKELRKTLINEVVTGKVRVID